MGMTPFQRFLNGLNAAQYDFNEVLNELRAFAEVMARKKNTLDMDEDGLFYITTSGTLEEVIVNTNKNLEKLLRIKQQKDSSKK